MNPHQKNKLDVSTLNPEEQRLFRLYGKLPNRNDLLQNKLKERKYFDSGDYALTKAGKASSVGVTTIGSQHPLPENIPHLSSPVPTSNGNGNGTNGQPSLQSHSPVKESSFLTRETTVDEPDRVTTNATEVQPRSPIPSPSEQKSVPLRWQS